MTLYLVYHTEPDDYFQDKHTSYHLDKEDAEKEYNALINDREQFRAKRIAAGHTSNEWDGMDGDGYEIGMEEKEVPDGTKYCLEQYAVSHNTIPDTIHSKTYYHETLEDIQESLEDFMFRMKDKGYIVLSITGVARWLGGDLDKYWIRDGEFFHIHPLTSDEEIELKPSEKLMKIIEEDKKKLQDYIV